MAEWRGDEGGDGGWSSRSGCMITAPENETLSVLVVVLVVGVGGLQLW